MAGANKKVIYAALFGNFGIAVSKFAAAAFTGSGAMFSEGVHSLVDTGNQVLLLYGLHRARLPADEQFPFGHGKEVYFWSFVVSILIFAVGSGVALYEGFQRLAHPHPIENPTVNYVVLGLALAIEFGVWRIAFREFDEVRGNRTHVQAVREAKDPTVFVVLFEDSAALLGLLVALFGIMAGQFTGIAYFDGGAAVIIGLILGGTAIWLAYESKGLLIGESARGEVVEGIREMVSRHRRVVHVNEVLTLHMGPDYVLGNLSVDFQDSCAVGEIETTVANLDREIKQQFPRVKRVFVEAESRAEHLREMPYEADS